MTYHLTKYLLLTKPTHRVTKLDQFDTTESQLC